MVHSVPPMPVRHLCLPTLQCIFRRCPASVRGTLQCIQRCAAMLLALMVAGRSLLPEDPSLRTIARDTWQEGRSTEMNEWPMMRTSRPRGISFPCYASPIRCMIVSRLRICDCAPKFRKTLTEHTRYAQNSRFLIYLFSVILRLRDGVGERPKGDVGTRSADCYFVYARSPMVLGLPLTERAEWC